MGDLAYHSYNFALMPIPMLSRMTFMTIPSVVTMYAAMMYYSDFLKAQTMYFYDPYHFEEFDFIIGKLSAKINCTLQMNCKLPHLNSIIFYRYSRWRFRRGRCSKSAFKK
jgi:hypothetical protein